MKFLSIEEKILNKISSDSLSNKEQIQLRFGFYLVLDMLKKGLLIYLSALVLGIVLEVLLVHLSFFILRQVSYGWHGRTNLECWLFSIIGFLALPFILVYSGAFINGKYLALSLIVLFVVILTIGPLGTKINSLDKDRIRPLRRKLISRFFLLIILFLLLPINMKLFVVIGVTIQAISLILQLFINLKSH